MKHWDIEITNRRVSLKVDVKGKKREKRYYPDVDYSRIWIEKHGAYYNGWLYGDADIIAFRLENSFLCVRRKTLIDLVKLSNVKPYNRRNKEELYYVPTDIIRKGVWKEYSL